MLLVGVGSIVDHYKNKEYRDGRTIASDWVQAGRPTEGAEFEAFQAHKRSQAKPPKVSNANSFRTAMSRFERESDKTINDYQKEQVKKQREKFIVGFKATKWRGKITKIDRYGEVKMDSEISGIWLYFKISTKTKQAKNWRVGDNVVFSGTIKNCFFISYYIDISEINKEF
jgi:hypothetical protein